MKIKMRDGFFFIFLSAVLWSGCAGLKSDLAKKWPCHSFLSRVFIGNLVEDGYVVTKSNDTLRGLLIIPRINDSNEKKPPSVSFLPYGKTTTADILQISIDTINDIKAKFPKDADTSEYICFDSKVWQIVGKRKNVYLLYQKWNYMDLGSLIDSHPHTYQETVLLINQGDKRTKHTIAISKPSKPVLLRFINKRYATRSSHFKQKDFDNSIKKMIDYILDQENEGSDNN